MQRNTNRKAVLKMRQSPDPHVDMSVEVVLIGERSLGVGHHLDQSAGDIAISWQLVPRQDLVGMFDLARIL
jgi:hypothetical protein